LRQPVDDGGCGRRLLGKESEWINLFRKQLPVATEYFKLVERVGGHIGNEDLPHSHPRMQPHGVTSAVPAVEGPHDADTTGVRGPDRKARSRHAVPREGMGSQHFVEPLMPAFAQQVKVELAKGPRESIEILFFLGGLTTRDAASLARKRSRPLGQSKELPPRLTPLPRNPSAVGWRADPPQALVI